MTATGALRPAAAREAAARFEWGYGRVARIDDVWPLVRLVERARADRLVRSSRGHLVATPAGRALVDDTAGLWRTCAGWLRRGLDPAPVLAAVRELTWASLLADSGQDLTRGAGGPPRDATPMRAVEVLLEHRGQVASLVAAGLGSEGWATVDGGEPLGRRDVEQMLVEIGWDADVLGVFRTYDDTFVASWQLTDAGRWLARAALTLAATAPRHL